MILKFDILMFCRVALKDMTTQQILLKFRQMQIFVVNVNDRFLYFLMSFPSVLFFIVSMLIFGTIRLILMKILFRGCSII